MNLIKILGVVVIFLVTQITAFAENDTDCKNMVTGTTNVSNVNAGQTYFNSHGAPAGLAPELAAFYNQNVDLSIVGLGNGLVPENRDYAACVTDLDGGDEALVKGYAWNDNLGFISFYCNGGTNEGLACGGVDYGVVIGADLAGMRALSGYAWNDAFGYIQFEGIGTKCTGVGAEITCDNFPYGVVMGADGTLSGDAWSEAGVYLKFDGAKIHLNEDSPELSVYIEEDPAGPEIHINATGPDGNPVDPSDYDIEMTFNWTDTVKINQLSIRDGGNRIDEVALSNEETPWAKGMGGVLYKPITINTNSTEFSDNFVEAEAGHYILDTNIKSMAPTSDVNVSYTTSTSTPFPISNEEFFSTLTNSDGEVWTDAITPNVLALNSVAYTVNGGESQVIYPNQSGRYTFSFDPLIQVDTLYTNYLEDTINAYRNIPMNFTIGIDGTGEDSYKEGRADFYLVYSEEETQGECSDGEETDFDFSFIDGGGTSFSVVLEGQDIDPFDIQAKASLPDFDEANELACEVARGPSLYSVISYKATADGHSERVSYYGNKLPRMTSSIINPAVVVLGNVSAQQVVEVSERSKVRTTGIVMVDKVRDSVDLNVEKYFVGEDKPSGGGTCTVSEMKTVNDLTVACGSGSGYKTYTVEPGTADEEYVLYFSNTDVTLDFASDADWGNKWGMILDGGNLFVESNVYHTDIDAGALAAVLLRPYNAECSTDSNVYISPNVTNIQANVAADCSLFSYSGDRGDIVDGLPVWDSFKEMIDTLGNQLYIEGSLSSRNTIGGADKDSDPEGRKDYLVLGTGETVSIEERQKAQLYDLNYLRLFRLELEFSDEERLPIDQSCGSALTPEDMVAIAEWKANGNVGAAPLSGPKTYEGGFFDGQLIECNGINPLQAFDATWSSDGDLMVPAGFDGLSEGLGHEDEDEDDGFNYEKRDPVYIRYVESDSFLFNKEGGLLTLIGKLFY